MKSVLRNKQHGVGLIEVLIATVVIALGLLAVASLQTGFMSSSSENKTKAEANVLAEQKLEELRNNIAVGGYNNVGVVSPASDTVTGTNASYTRIWTVTDVAPFLAGSPNRKNISVQVSWDSDGGTDSDGDGSAIDANEKINLVTEMAWIDPADSATYAGQQASSGTQGIPSPRQNASEDVASENVIGTNLAITDLDISTEGSAGVDATLQVTIPSDDDDGGSMTPTLTQVGPGLHFYTATHADLATVEEGVIAVFLCQDADNDVSTQDTCTHIQNHFGGVVHYITGTVHNTSSNGFDDIKVAWTSSSINDCYNGTITEVDTSGNDQYRYRPYECIFAGNCDETPDDVNGCVHGVTDDQIEARNVGPGGEYGDVGLLGVDDQGGDREQVCFLEDTGDPATSPLLDTSGGDVLNEDYLFSVTKRFYVARKVVNDGTDNTQKSEGINRSFTNHNFLVVSRGTGGSANQTCNLKAATPRSGSSSIQLAPREIIKVMNESDANTSLAPYAYAGATGTAKTFTDAVQSSYTDLKLIIPDIGNCYINNNSGDTPTAYACVVPSDTTSIAIKGVSQEHPTADPGVFSSCTKSDDTTCNWLNNFTTDDSDSDCTTPWGTTVGTDGTAAGYLAEIEPYNTSITECENAVERTCSDGSSWDQSFGSYIYGSCVIADSPNCTVTLDGTETTITGDPATTVEAYTLAIGQTAEVCASARSDRTCDNGILTGYGSYTTCSTQTTRDISVTIATSGTGSVSGVTITGTDATCSGTTCTVADDWTGTLSATGSCSGTPSTVSGSVNIASNTITAATITMGECTGSACTMPWGGSLASGAPGVPVYETATVDYPNTCNSEYIFCNDGVLSGSSFTNPSCSQVCTVPNIVGMATNNTSRIAVVDSTIRAAGFTVGTKTLTNSGSREVQAQSLSSGTATCGTAIDYTLND